MPYASDAQRRFMHAVHPDIAAKWDKEQHSSKGPHKMPKRKTKRKAKRS